MKNELKKSRQYFRSVGVVSELNLKLEDCKIKLKDQDGNEKQVDGERIMGSVALRTPRGIHTFNAYFQSLGFDGNPNKQWKMANDMLSWNPEINGTGEEPTRVSIEGQVDINDYHKDGNVYSNLRWRISKASTKVGEDDPAGTTLDVVAYVHKIVAEEVNDEETGRLKITLMLADYKGSCFPIEAIVDKDLADAVEENIEKETTIPVTLNRTMHRIGGTKKKIEKRMIGGAGDVEVNTGFDVGELILVGADEPIEEPEEIEDDDGNPIEDKSGYIDPATMKKAMKVRVAMLEEIKNNPPEKKSGGKNDFKSQKAQAQKATKNKSKAVGSGAGKPPFDTDDGDDEDLF